MKEHENDVLPNVNESTATVDSTTADENVTKKGKIEGFLGGRDDGEDTMVDVVGADVVVDENVTKGGKIDFEQSHEEPEETVVTDNKEVTETDSSHSTKEIVKQSTESVQEVADSDHIMHENTGKEAEVLNFLKTIDSSTTPVNSSSLDGRMAAVHEGLFGKDEAEDAVSNQTSLAEVVTIEDNVNVSNKNSDQRAVLDLSKIPDFSYEEVHMEERAEGAGMDIDEVLGWKEDEIPEINSFTNDVSEPLNEASISLQQSSYFHPPENKGEFSPSDLVWGKVRSHPWWPGQIFHPSDASDKAMKHHKKDCFLVAYFGDRTFAWNDSSVLKPFRAKFPQIHNHTDSESFHHAVHCALEEVQRRVELGLSCSCIPNSIHEKIECQIVENTGVKKESSRRFGIDKSANVNSFEPDKLIDYVKLLAKSPYGENDEFDLTMAKAQLSSYVRFKGYRELPDIQFCGTLLEDVSLSQGFDFDFDQDNKDTQLTEYLPQILSQLHLTAQNPTKEHTFLNTIIPFFYNYRTDVVQRQSVSRKRKTLNEINLEEFEFEIDDVNDAYWTDRIVQNTNPEEKHVQVHDNQNGGAQHQIVSYEQDNNNNVTKSVKASRRSNKKRYFDGNHEIEAKEEAEIMERRRLNMATEVLMKYSEGIYFPSELHLNKMFRRFGPLVESETEVDRQSGRARVVFKRCSDAEVAHNSAGKFNIFGEIGVSYEINYTPLISYKPLPLPFVQDPPDAR